MYWQYESIASINILPVLKYLKYWLRELPGLLVYRRFTYIY